MQYRHCERFMYIRLDLHASLLPLLQIGVLLFFEDNKIGKKKIPQREGPSYI